jgi:hypothetical protein
MITKKKKTGSGKRKKSEMIGLSDILSNYDLDNTGKYISQEFQDFGYRMAMELNDKKRVGMYMRLSKTIDRSILEAALSFVKDAENARNKAALFMWKLKQLRGGKKK